MKVLLLAPQPFYAERGTPIAVKWVAETLAEMGLEVDLLTLPFGQDVEIPGVTIHRCRRPPGVSHVPIGFSPQKVLCGFSLVREAKRLIRANRYEVVHACEESVFPARALAKRAGAKLVYDMDSSMADQLMEKWAFLRVFRSLLEGFEKRAIRSADLILPVCRSLEDKVKSVSPGAHTVILSDMAMEFPPVPAGTEDLRATLNIPGPFALYVGNLEHYQGIDLLLDGFAAAGPDLHLVVIGGATKDLAACRARADDLGIADRVHWLGPRPLSRLQYYLDQADILVSPRLRGVNTPMKVYSYLLAAKAIVATRIESHTQVLDDETAVLVEPRAIALGSALRELAEDPARRIRLGEAAGARARERHSRAAYRAALRRAYADLGVVASD